MKTVEVDDTTTPLADLLDAVAGGEAVTITKDGAPVARLVPTDPPEPVPAAEVARALRAIEEWEAFRKRRNITLGDITIRELIDEGRRF